MTITLHWHRWRTRRGLSYWLQAEPWNGDETGRVLGTEYANVRRVDGRWRYEILLPAHGINYWGLVGSPARARRLAEELLDKRSFAIWGDDRLQVQG